MVCFTNVIVALSRQTAAHAWSVGLVSVRLWVNFLSFAQVLHWYHLFRRHAVS